MPPATTEALTRLAHKPKSWGKITALAVVTTLVGLGAWATAGGGAHQPPPAAIPTIAQAARAIGATDVGKPYTPKMFATQYADATWHGHPVTIATFASSSLEADWVNTAGVAGPIVAEGDLYAAVETGGQS